MIYLDHNATTPMSSSVKEVFINSLEVWANPNSPSFEGVLAASEIKKVESTLNAHINGFNGEVIWTSGASQSNRLVVESLAKKFNAVVVTSNIEHKSILDFGSIFLSVNNTGTIDLSSLPSILKPYIEKRKPVILSLMLVNNETGIFNSLSNIGKGVRVLQEKGHYIYFHIDATQALGKKMIDTASLNCDFISFSGHKIYGPKGIGALWMRKGYASFFGYQGTPNLPAILGFGQAIKEIDLSSSLVYLKSLEDLFLQALYVNKIPFSLNGSSSLRVPGTLNIAFLNTKNIDLVIDLMEKETVISTGAACSSKDMHSKVLKAMGASKEILNSSVRISFGLTNTRDQIKKIISQIKDILI